MSIFTNIPEDKRTRLLEACYQTFSKEGYEKASINEILKESKISKGLLYHYFSGKQELYVELANYAINDFERMYNLQNLDPSPDYIVRTKQLALLKFNIFEEQPYFLNFFGSMFKEEDTFIIDKIREIRSDTMKRYQSILYGGYDQTLFREDLDPALVIESIIATLEAFAVKLNQAHFIDGEYKISKEQMEVYLDKYCDFFAKSFYKSDYKWQGGAE